MTTDNLVEISKSHGPNGFLEFNQNYYAVTDGKIAGLDGSTIGILYEDGVIDGKQAPFDGWSKPKNIQELPGCVFRGIDSKGITMEIPGKPGPTGMLRYNHEVLHVINGRISNKSHQLLGEISDEGVITLRDFKTPTKTHVMDDLCQLQTEFRGISSKGTPLDLNHERPLHKRKDLTYSQNEIITYFDLDWHNLTDIEQSYIIDSMKLWTRTGILQLVRRATGAGRAAFGNVRHGASGVTGVLTAYVTIDRDEFETEINLFRNYGILSFHSRRDSPAGTEVRVNLVVSHEFGHQVEFTLSQACHDKINRLYESKSRTCAEKHPQLESSDGKEILNSMELIPSRCFISGYSRFTMHEYWAESLAAFSMAESREELKKIDPEIHQILTDFISAPEDWLSPQHQETALRLQTSLRVGGELTEDLLLQ